MQFAHFSANLQQNYNGLWYLTLRMIKTRVKPGFFIGKPEKTRNPGFLTDRAKQQPYKLGRKTFTTFVQKIEVLDGVYFIGHHNFSIAPLSALMTLKHVLLTLSKISSKLLPSVSIVTQFESSWNFL